MVIWNAAVVITRMLEDENHRRYLVGTALDRPAAREGDGEGDGQGEGERDGEGGEEGDGQRWPLTVLE